MRLEIELAISEMASSKIRQGPAARVIVEGSPTVVQRIADAIETVIPGFMEWHDHAPSGSNDGHIIIEGAGARSPVGKM